MNIVNRRRQSFKWAIQNSLALQYFVHISGALDSQDAQDSQRLFVYAFVVRCKPIRYFHIAKKRSKGLMNVVEDSCDFGMLTGF